MTIFTSAARTLGHLMIASSTLKSYRWTAFMQALGMLACARALMAVDENMPKEGPSGMILAIASGVSAYDIIQIPR